MDSVLGWLPFIGCAAMMLFCLRMALGSGNQQQERDGASTQQEIAELREEVARVRAERAIAGEHEQARG